MKTKFKAHLLQYFSRKTRQPGMTLPELLIVLGIIIILAPIALQSLLSPCCVNKGVEGRNNVGAMNRAQQAYFLENGDFADYLYQLGLGIRNSSNYEYSIEKTPLAAFQYGTSLNAWKSYVGIVVPPSPENSDKISTQAILCEHEHQAAMKPSEPMRVEDGVLQCGENMKQLGDSPDGLDGIKIEKDWEIAYRAWELASEGKYDPALELAQTITDDWHKDNANSAIAHELVASGQNDKALELAQTITDAENKASVLSEIVGKLAEAGEYESALELSETIANDLYQAQAKTFLASALHLASDAQFNRALEIASTITDDWPKASTLIYTVPHLTSDAQYDRALEIAATITDDWPKSGALKAIAQSDRALEVIATITDEREKASTLIDIAPHLTSKAQYNRALEIAKTITYRRTKKQAVKAIKQAKKSHKSTTDD